MSGPRSGVVGSGLAIAVVAIMASADEGCVVSCTEIGCIDQTVVTLHTASGTWAAGTYSLELTAGSLAATCTFTTADPMSDPVQMVCSTTAIRVEFRPFGDCRTDEDDAGGTIDVCHGVPSAFQLLVTVPGVFPQIAIDLTRDGQNASGGILAPQYHVNQPNGAECGPTCHQAAADMVVGP
jgi:hypothetical protein